MTLTPAPRPRLLLGVATAMGLTIFGLLVATALAQNRYDIVADVQGFDPGDGTELWADRLEPASQPRFAGDFLVFVSDERVFALDAAGELQWSTAVPGSRSTSSAGEYVAVSARGPGVGYRVVYLDAADGSVMWERPGSFRFAGPTIAVIFRTVRVVLVDPASGDNLRRFKKRRSDTVVVGDSAVARLRKGAVTVFTANGEPTRILRGLPNGARLLAIEDGVVLMNVPTGGSGRIVSAHDLNTGAELWQQPASEYRPAPPDDSVAMYLGETPWLAAPDGSVAVTLGQEADSTEGAVTYLDILGTTYAIDKASGQVLWTRADKIPLAATTGMAVFKYKDRYEVVADATGTTIAEVPLERGRNVHAVAGRVLLDTGPTVFMVEADGTVTALYDEPGQLWKVSADYAAVLDRGDNESSGLVVIELASGEEVLNRTFQRIYGLTDFDGTKLRLRHPRGGTEIDLVTGQTTEIAAPDTSTAPESMLMNQAVLVFDPERERLLWTAPALSTTSVAFLDDTLVVSTPKFEHRDS